MQVEPDNVVDLGGQFGVGGGLEGPNAPGLDAVLAPDAGNGVAADPEFAGQQPGRPVGDPQPGRWRVEGGRQDLGPAEPTDRLWSSRSRSVGEPLPPAADISAAAGDHGRAGDANALGDLGVGGAVGGQEQDAGALDEDGWQLADRAQRYSSARSSGVMSSAAAAGIGYGRTATNGDLTHRPHRCRGGYRRPRPSSMRRPRAEQPCRR